MVQPIGNNRISKIDTYLNVAEVFAYRSTCLKRKYGGHRQGRRGRFDRL